MNATYDLYLINITKVSISNEQYDTMEQASSGDSLSVCSSEACNKVMEQPTFISSTIVQHLK